MSTINKVRCAIVVFTLIIIGGVVFSICSGSPPVDYTLKYLRIILPSGSTNVVHFGNGWATFEFRGMKFLYRYESHGQVLTRIE